MNNLYETLGIGEGATPKQIKRAYRRIMKEIHPDKNDGVRHPEHEDFQTAYDVLMDPDRRAEYDETGTVDGIDKARQRIIALVQDAVKQMDSESVKHADIKAAIINALQDEKKHLDINIGTVERKAEIMQEMARRTKAGMRAVFIPQMLYAGIKEVEKVIEEARKDIEAVDDAIKIMEDFEYEFEPDPPQRRTGGWHRL